jgi:hypothetical protein
MAGKAYIEIETENLAGAQLALGSPSTFGTIGTHSEIGRLINLLNAMASGVHPGVVRVRTDDSTGTAASQAATVAQASFTAGDKLIITIPGVQPLVYTAILTGTPVYGSGQFLAATSDTATAASLAAAIVADQRAQRAGITATASVAVCTITANARMGSAGNAIKAQKFVTTAGAFSLANSGAFTGGHDPGVLSTSTLALSGALTVNDTVTIGGVVLTAVAVPANESQFVGAVSAAADGAALVACINAHSKLKGIILASGTSTVTLTFRVGGRMGTLVTVAKSAAAITLTGANFAPLSTDVWATSMVEYRIGISPA